MAINGKKAYELRETGIKWKAVAFSMRLKTPQQAFNAARYYSIYEGKAWPIKAKDWRIK